MEFQRCEQKFALLFALCTLLKVVVNDQKSLFCQVVELFHPLKDIKYISKMMEISSNDPNNKLKFMKNFDLIVAACTKLRESSNDITGNEIDEALKMIFHETKTCGRAKSLECIVRIEEIQFNPEDYRKSIHAAPFLLELHANGSVANYFICAGGEMVEQRTTVNAEAIFYLLSFYYVFDISNGKAYEQFLSFFQVFGIKFDTSVAKSLNFKKFANRFKPIFATIQSE